jgi:dihydrofolate synthase/folylpolyglutamate synthase
MSTLSDYLAALEKRAPSIYIDCTIGRIQQAYAALGLSPFDAVVVKVAGTNGKGSTVSALQHLYTAAGYRVASYTSPHLLHFTERLHIDAMPVSEQAWCDALVVIDPVADRYRLTYFETITLAAFFIIHAHPVDIVLLEIGLGGRHDAVNCIPANHGIITSIGLDHQQLLGDTVEAIAWEKAGIIDPQMSVVYASDVAESVISGYAKQQSATYYQLSQDFQWEWRDNQWVFTHAKRTWALPYPPIHPDVAAGVLMTLWALEPLLPFAEATIEEQWLCTAPVGRCQYFPSAATYLDVSHNVPAISHLMEVVATQHPDNPIRVVFSCLSDKAIDAIVPLFGAQVSGFYLAELPAKRALPIADMKQALQGHTCYFFSSIAEAYQQACLDRSTNELVIACGSFYVVEALLPYLHGV